MTQSTTILLAGAIVALSILVDGHLDRRNSTDTIESEILRMCYYEMVESNPNIPKQRLWMICHRRLNGIDPLL